MQVASVAEHAELGAARLEGGNGPIAWQLNGFARKADDLSIPGYARSKRLRENDPLPPGEKEPYGILPNSAITTYGGGGGMSFVGDAGYFGVAPSYYKTDYGTVAEPGLAFTAPGKGEIMMPPVSVCHQVSTMGQRPSPTTR